MSGSGDAPGLYIRLAKRQNATLVRLLTVPLIVAVFILGVQVAVHYDGTSHDESHCTCQVCHIAHAAVPQPSAQAQIQALCAWCGSRP